MAKYLDVKYDLVVAAASLLVDSGFWIEVERELGKPVKYRVVGHKEWSVKNGGRYCCTLDDFPLAERTHANLIGKILFGVTGEKLFPNVVAGWRKLVESDQELIDQAQEFMKTDLGQGSGVARRVRFGRYLRERRKKLSECNEVSQKTG